MAKKTYAFNSVDGDRKYNADNIAFDKAIFYSDGVVVQGGNVIGSQLKVEAVEGMQVKVNAGTAIIKGYTVTFDGVADGSELVTLPQSDLTKDRIDRVVLELNLNDDKRDIILKSIQGTPATNPTVPTLTRTDLVYQISLAQIRVIANSGTIGTITDERSNSEVCGISNITVGITPPTGNDAVTVTVSDATKSLFSGKENVDACLQQLNSYVPLSRPLELTTGVIFENGVWLDKNAMGVLIKSEASGPSLTLQADGLRVSDTQTRNVTFRFLFSKPLPKLCSGKKLKVSFYSCKGSSVTVAFLSMFNSAFFDVYSATSAPNDAWNTYTNKVVEVVLPELNSEIGVPCFTGFYISHSSDTYDWNFGMVIKKIEIINA